MQSNGTGAPSMKAMLPRCRSPWHSRTKPLAPARSNARRKPRALRARPGAQRVEARVRAGVGAASARDLVEVAERRRRDLLRRAEASAAPAPRRGAWNARDAPRRARRSARRSSAPRRAMRVGERVRAAKRRILHRVLDRRRPARRPRSAVRAARDRHHVQVELRRGAPVEAQLLLAVVAARCQRAEIEERQAHRLLHLVGVVAGEQHPGDVRLDAPRPPSTGCG